MVRKKIIFPTFEVYWVFPFIFFFNFQTRFKNDCGKIEGLPLFFRKMTLKGMSKFVYFTIPSFWLYWFLTSIFQFYSRNSFDFTQDFGSRASDGKFSYYIEKALDPNVESVILDGEICPFNKKTQTLSQKGEWESVICKSYVTYDYHEFFLQ